VVAGLLLVTRGAVVGLDYEHDTAYGVADFLRYDVNEVVLDLVVRLPPEFAVRASHPRCDPAVWPCRLSGLSAAFTRRGDLPPTAGRACPP
jgi:hypothetical protein